MQHWPDFQWILLRILPGWPAVAVTCRGRVTPQDLGTAALLDLRSGVFYFL